MMKLILFKNNKGHTMRLNPKLTIADLVKMGMKDIKLVPKNKPIRDNWWAHKP